MQWLSLFIATRSGNAGSIHVTGAPAIAMKGDPFSAATFQLMVHMTEHNEVGSSLLLHAVESKGEIAITPVDMRLLPITPARTVCIRSKPCGPAVRKHNERPISWCQSGCRHDAIGRILLSDRSKHSLNSLREVKTTSRTARPGTDHGKLRLFPLAQPPRAVPITQHRHLLLKQRAASVTPPVVISQENGHR